MSVTTSPATGGRPAAARRRRARPSLDRITFMAAFLGLPLLIFVVFVLWPVVQAFYYSMTDWSGFSSEMHFTGLDNFQKLVHDEIFLHAVRNNLLLALVVPAVTIVAALAIAIVVTVGGPSSGTIRGIRGAGGYRVISFFPYVVPAVVIGLIWAQVFDPAAGLLNGFLTKIGLSGFKDFAWLGETSTAMPASMFVMIWASVGFYTVLFVAAIKGIPAEMYESARLDGAGRFRTSWSITVPLIRDNVQTAYIYIGILALDAFVFMQAMNPGGGPNNTTLTMSQYLLTTAFKKGQFGYATAMGVVLALITLAFALVVFAISYLTGGRDERRGRR